MLYTSILSGPGGIDFSSYLGEVLGIALATMLLPIVVCLIKKPKNKKQLAITVAVTALMFAVYSDGADIANLIVDFTISGLINYFVLVNFFGR